MAMWPVLFRVKGFCAEDFIDQRHNPQTKLANFQRPLTTKRLQLSNSDICASAAGKKSGSIIPRTRIDKILFKISSKPPDA